VASRLLCLSPALLQTTCLIFF